MRHVKARRDDDSIRFVDYGIRGMHLAYDLLDGWDALILVDAVPDRGSPGTVHVFEVDHESRASTAGFDAHGMDPNAVFDSLSSLGGTAPRTLVIGCEVADIGDGIGLSEPVRGAVAEAVLAIDSALAMLQSEASATIREG